MSNALEILGQRVEEAVGLIAALRERASVLERELEAARLAPRPPEPPAPSATPAPPDPPAVAAAELQRLRAERDAVRERVRELIREIDRVQW